MTQLFPFAPRPRAAFQFNPVLDGETTTAVVTWNIFRMGWYVNVYDLNGVRIFTLPVAESPDPVAVTSASWDSLRRRVVVTTATPHQIPIGTKAELTFAGFTPLTYCLTVVCDVLGPSKLAYAAATDPGTVVPLGTTCAEVDLCGGYFASRMVYRGSARRFEVTP